MNLFGRSKGASPTPSRSPSPPNSGHASRSTSPADFMAIVRQEDVGMPVVPSYDESQAGQPGGPEFKDDWVIGTHTASRMLFVSHNPNPTGNFSDLDMSHSGAVDGLGPWKLKVMSDVVSLRF
jgi:hypothetical protein